MGLIGVPAGGRWLLLLFNISPGFRRVFILAAAIALLTTAAGCRGGTVLPGGQNGGGAPVDQPGGGSADSRPDSGGGGAGGGREGDGAAFPGGGTGPTGTGPVREGEVPPHPGPRGTIKYGAVGHLSLINPLLSPTEPELLVLEHVFSYGLVRPGSDGAPVPNLARRWEYSEDGLVWTFHMRDDVFWHDGPPVTAHDAAYTFRMLTDPEYTEPPARDYAVIREAEAADDHTLRLHLEEPWAPLLQALTVPLLPRHLYARVPPSRLQEAVFNRAPVGYGPFRLTDFTEDRLAVLQAYDEFWDDGPFISRIEVHAFPDYDGLLRALTDGTVQAAGPFPVGRRGASAAGVDEARRRLADSHTFAEYGSLEYAYIGLNHQHPLFSDVGVRRALMHAVNREAIIEEVLGGYGLPAISHYGPASWAYDAHIDPYRYDPGRAAELLEAAGFTDDGSGGPRRGPGGTPFTFTVASVLGDEEMEQVLTMAAADFAAVGVNMEVEFHPWEDFLAAIEGGRFDAYASGFELAPDPDAHIFFYGGGPLPPFGPGRSFNDTGYADAETDELLMAGLRELDPARRRSIYVQLHRRINSRLPLLFLYSPVRVAVTPARLTGVEETAHGPSLRHLWRIHP